MVKISIRLFKVINIGLSLIGIMCPSIAAAYDFTFTAYGPHHVVHGYDMFIRQDSIVTEGTRDYAYYYVDGMPTGVTNSYPEILDGQMCCSGNESWEPRFILLGLNVPSNVPTGTYNLTLRVVSGGITKTIPWQMIVDPVPGPLSSQTITSVPPIPALSQWQSAMITYGQQFCDVNYINEHPPGDEIGLWYYDGERTAFQIADYTGQSSPWNQCAQDVEAVFKSYVQESQVSGWRVFPHGLYQDYLRNNDTTSKAAAIRLSTDSAYSDSGGEVSYGEQGLQRETAYLVHAYRIAGLLGSPNARLYARSVNFSLGIIDQVFVSKTDPYLKPFMMGLLAEALIQYYEQTNDPRIPPAIKAAMDDMWSRAWSATNKAFYYDSNTPTDWAPDLNLLIAPAYAWLYKMTGDPIYQQRGDAIFEGGVTQACVGCGGKWFNQNYRWSFDYVNWRLNPGATLTQIQPPSGFRVQN